MPRRLTDTELVVFVASPGDVSPEREAVESVVRELNLVWSRRMGIRLELVRWETHAYPGLGVDAQDVINRQLPNDYDLFIGIMWTRFGTPTTRAESGTVEEFERALGRHLTDSSSVHLMVYFKTALVDPILVDVGQLKLVRDFRQRVRDAGGLTWDFAATADFENFVRIHLTKFIQDWRDRHKGAEQLEEGQRSTEMLSAAVSETHAGLSDDRDNVGFFDLVEESASALQRSAESTARLTSATTTLTDQVNAHGAKLISSNASKDVQAVKRIFSEFAHDLNTYARVVREETPVFASSVEDGIRGAGQAAGIAPEFGARQEVEPVLAELADKLGLLRAAYTSHLERLEETRQVAAGLPRFTVAFNRARRNANDAMEAFEARLRSAARLLEEAEASIRGMYEGETS